MTGKVSNMVAAKGEATASMSALEGILVTCITLSIWFIVDVPGKTGLPLSISPVREKKQKKRVRKRRSGVSDRDGSGCAVRVDIFI
jgi:hypothetical protein